MKQIMKIMLASLLLIGIIPIPLVQSYDATVSDFNRLWYDNTIGGGFNKDGNGALVLATTYTNNTLRTIDSCSIEFQQGPFYFKISFQDTLQRDNEGNIIEPKNGYFYLRKALVQNFFPSDLRQLASKNLAYKTIEYNGDTWFQLSVPNFNQEYEWGTYRDANIGENWYTWGNKNTIRFQERAMIIKKIKDTIGTLEFDITHNSDTSGQQITISKDYLKSKGITHPVFELNKKLSLPYTQNETHYFIRPPHFSYLSLHEAVSGTINGSIPVQLQATRDDGDFVTNVWCNQSIIFATFQNDGLRAYTFNGTALFLKDTLDDGGFYGAVHGNSSYIFTANGASGVRAYTYSGGTLTLAGSIDDGGYYYDVWCDENYVYCACGEDIKAYSFSGATFTLLDTIDNTTSTYGSICGNNTYIYTEGNTAGLFVYSFDGTTLTLIDSQDDGGCYYDVFCNETHIFVGYDDNGLRAYQCSSGSLTLLAELTELGGSDNVMLGGGINKSYVYYTDFDDGIYVHTLSGSHFVFKDSFDDTNGYYPGILHNDSYFVGTHRNGLRAYNLFEEFNVTRIVGANSESNNFTFTPTHNKTANNSCIVLCCPVSNDTRGIVDVTNNTCGTQATNVLSFDALRNSTYWYDAANQNVYIGTINLTTSTVVNWTVNCSYGANFSIHIPEYLTVGDYLIMQGMIENSTGSPIDGLVASTYIFFENGSVAIGEDPFIKWNCSNGNYECTISTTVLPPGIYLVYIEFTDPDTGVTFSFGETLYLSYDTPVGVYSDAIVYISFYNTNEGLGLPRETLKVYVDEERVYSNVFYSYTGAVINVTIKDYYNTLLYHNNFTITQTRTFLDLGLTFHSWLFSDKNDDYYMISLRKEGATRWWERGIVPYGEREFLIPSGNYSMRIYDADYNEVYNTSDHGGNVTIVNSRVYVIHGTNLSLIINGQSVIQGQLLELTMLIDYALTPDEILWSVNPISVFSAFDKYGMMLGNNVWKVCPPKIVVATTRNSTFAGNVTFIPLIPENDSTNFGSISVKEDVLYLSGTADYVNVSYTDSGVCIQNTTHVESPVYLPGGEGSNITVNCSNDVFILRETTYHQEKKFYWDITNSTINDGYILNRGGYHAASIQVVNSLNTSLFNVRVLAGFSNKTTPDFSTARVTDIHNGVVTDDQSDDFKTGGSGIEFQIDGGIPAWTTRNFLLEYYGDITSNYEYGDVQREILPGFDTGVTLANDNQFYNFEDVRMHNVYTVGFKGSLHIRFNIPMDVDADSIKVQDMDNNLMLESDQFIPSAEFVYISNDAIGTVSAGGVRTFGVYWQEDMSMSSEPGVLTLGSIIFYLGAVPITLLFCVNAFSFLVFGGSGTYGLLRKKRWDKKSLFLIILPFIILIFSLMFQALGF